MVIRKARNKEYVKGQWLWCHTSYDPIFEQLMKTAYRMALISNPLSGFNKKRGLEYINAVAKSHCIPHWHAIPGNQLEQALHQIANKMPEILIINGGDGTVDSVITLIRLHKIFRKEPIFVLLQGGTTNMVHRDVGLNGAPHQAIEKLIAHVKNGMPKAAVRKRHPMAIYEKQELKTYGFFWSLGAIPRITEKIRRQYHQKGFTGRISEILFFISALWPLLSKTYERNTLFMPSSFSYQVDSDKDSHGKQMVFAAATTLDSLLFGIKPGEASNGIKLFGLPHPYKNIAATITKLLTGVPMAYWKNQFFHVCGNAFELSFASEWVVDGEPYSTDKSHKKIHIELADPIEFLVI